MSTDPSPPKIYRPWLMIAVLALGLTVIISQSVPYVVQLLQPDIPSARGEALRTLAPVGLLILLFGWHMTNRFKLYADRFDNRYLWRRQKVLRSDIVRVEEIQAIRGRTAAVLSVRQSDGQERLIAVTPPGQGGKALAAWLEGLPRRNP